MLYSRFYGLDPTGSADGVKTAPSTHAFIAEANELRARAHRCRQLAATFYDQRIITELEDYATELEREVALLALDNRRFLRASAG